MDKILIIGSSGAGKSTLARELGERLDLPVIHLDKEFWRPGWGVTDRPIWNAKVVQLASGEKWILDGNFDSSLHLRLPQADTVIFLDFSPLLCLWRVFRRRLKYRGTHRPDMTEGCNEQLDYSFASWIWRFRKDTAPTIYNILEHNGAGKNVVILKTPKQLADWMRSQTLRV